MRELGVKYLRTGLSWSDAFREGADVWFDRMMGVLEPFTVTATFCFTPEHLGVNTHHTSPPKEPERFADFCAMMVRRYAPGAGGPAGAVAAAERGGAPVAARA
jgi:beta-xylosidase